MASAIRQVMEMSRRRHRIAPGATANFAIRNLSQIAAVAASSGRIMALLLAAVGIFCGYCPARKAARLDPVEASRYK